MHHDDEAAASYFARSVHGEYATILADPPWQFTNRTGKVAPEHTRLVHYPTLKLGRNHGDSGWAGGCYAKPLVFMGAECVAGGGSGGDERLGLHLQDQPDLAQSA